MANLQCFVIMPIKKDASEEYRHYRTLYEEWIKPVPEGQGYKVVRADDIQRSGLITQDVILGLARADLVVADLTDLNPNVFYELGVRHALRGQGTIMLLDENRTKDVPFDISPYRVIKFTSDMYGLSNLRKKLSAYIDSLSAEASLETARDNPVHDSIPALPIDILAASTGTEEGALREQLTNALRTLQNYRRQFGELNQDRQPESAEYRIQALLQKVHDGGYGPDLAKSAHAAAARQDKESYLNILRRLVQDDAVRLDARAYLSLASDATSLGLNEAVSIVFEIARRVHPNDDGIRSAELAHLVHSFDPAERLRARGELLRSLSIRVEESKVSVPDHLDDRQFSLCGLMLDAYHEDNLNEEALRITEALMAKFPNNTVVVRNHARALERMGLSDESLHWFQRAIWCPNVDDTSAVWLGSELHNRYRNVDALEAFALACTLDPNDATQFAHMCDEISRALDERDEHEYQGLEAAKSRLLPSEISIATLHSTMLAAFSCEYLRQEAIDRCVSAATRAGIDTEVVALMMSIRSGQQVELDGQMVGQLRLSERRRFAVEIRRLLASSVTVQPETDRGELPPADAGQVA